jgi:hypothetical protein
MANTNPPLFDLPISPDAKVATPVAPGKEGNRYRRTIVARVEIIDSGQLRDSALRLYDDGTIVIVEVVGEDTGVDTRDEIGSNDTEALHWLIDQFDGLWDLIEEESLEFVKASSEVDDSDPDSLKITYGATIRLLRPDLFQKRALAMCGADPDARREVTRSLAATWIAVAPPELALARASGIKTTIESVKVERV